MNIETVIQELEAANPLTSPSNSSVDAAWSEFRTSVVTPRNARRWILTFSGIAAAAVAIAVLLSGTVPLGKPPTAAAAQLTRIADAAQAQQGIASILPTHYDYLETYESANDVSRKIDGKRIDATQSATSEQWILLRASGVSDACRFKQTVGSVSFLGNSEKIWKRLGEPSIGAKNSNITGGSCGRYAPLGNGVALPTHLTPATLLAAIKSVGHPTDAEVFLALINIYFGVAPPSPALRGAILDDMAQLNGVVALGTRKDSLGRSGLGFSHAITRAPGCLGHCGRVHYIVSIIVSPATGSLLSTTSNQQGPTNTTTIEEHAVVDSIHSVVSSNN